MYQVTKMSCGPTPVGEYQFHMYPPPVNNATAAQEQVVFGSVLCSFVVVTLCVLPAACLCFLHVIYSIW